MYIEKRGGDEYRKLNKSRQVVYQLNNKTFSFIFFGVIERINPI